jgi:hypothetical protein
MCHALCMDSGFWVAWGLATGSFLVGVVGLLIRAIRLRKFFIWQSEVIGYLQARRRPGEDIKQFIPTKKFLGRPVAEWQILTPAVISLTGFCITLVKLLIDQVAAG